MIIRDLGTVDYLTTLQAMQSFTANRQADSADELWLLEHLPVFSQGYNGQPEHLLSTGDIPVVQSDRGGQVTYHGPGQLVLYTLIDLKRRGLGVRHMVRLLEQAVIALLAEHQLEAYARRDAPGVYVAEAKIASLGLRVRHGACYHGLSLNVAMDLRPFALINPCGYAGMPVTDLQQLGLNLSVNDIKQPLAMRLQAALSQAEQNQS